MSKILITGGTGYIGSHIAILLLENGFEVVLVDNLSNSDINSLDRIEEIAGKRPYFYELDICDEKSFEKVFVEHSDIDGVIHLASLKAVGESVEKPLLYYRNNLLGVLNVLELMNKYNINNIIFSSSACVYGDPETVPIKEDAPIKTQESPYGNCKKITEEKLYDLCQADSDLQATILRYFNVIGAHPSGKIGELPRGVPNNLVPRLVQAVSGAQEPLKVFGNNYNTKDGYGVRDYLHVLDVAEAHIAALKRMLKKEQKTSYEVFNIGTGQGSSVKELIDTFEEVTGEKVPYELASRRPGDIDSSYADPSLAQEELNWQAKHTLAESLKHAWEWEKKYRESRNAYRASHNS